MLPRITLALAGVAAVSAQSLADIQARLPVCSLQCLLTSATEFNCRIDDIACQCENAAGIEESVTPCLLQAGCTMEELETVRSVSVELCQGQGDDAVATTTGTAPSASSPAESAPAGASPGEDSDEDSDDDSSDSSPPAATSAVSAPTSGTNTTMPTGGVAEPSDTPIAAAANALNSGMAGLAALAVAAAML
ncbi:hypothetical protein S7711_10333 [Stachybotrys chartarum IBT 7711]|uniref:CFEM domain-containing protein n=1 Tax=Stachybotrys chartarum (strain CBS 109288 / IBT 7711) TaxID=1280523 RepID=A0A084B3B4_STACB|nr:hypothetical protein S7711_10333 [Stachybotrys chartarum IBT 7711]KFA52350.1 hypothetical protein S40293_10392 [Stachybotrys chartarum IBT 40293]